MKGGADEAGLPLREAQIEAFDRDGFIAIDALTDLAEIDTLRSLYDELFRRASGFAAGDRLELVADGERSLLPQIVNPERYVPQLIAGRAFRNAQRIAWQLLGDGFEPAGNHAIMKPAGLGAATPWHQDEAYWDPRCAHRAISIWMPLQAATLANGCMQFMAGSHRGPVFPHELISATAHGLRLTQPAPAGPASACELPAGGATIHAGRTLHYAGANSSNQPRRALVFGFRTPPVGLREPHHYPWQRPEWFADPACNNLNP
jgi:ectoine hydroxylase-related dioxygenase (phytanoyl-CoA dioxygenase family)